MTYVFLETPKLHIIPCQCIQKGNNMGQVEHRSDFDFEQLPRELLLSTSPFSI